MTEADLGKGVVSVTLVPCEGEKAGSMALENVPSKGQWYSFDVARMSESVGLPASTAACDLIQVDPSPNSSLPLKKKVRGVVKVVFASSARAEEEGEGGGKGRFRILGTGCCSPKIGEVLAFLHAHPLPRSRKQL